LEEERLFVCSILGLCFGGRRLGIVWILGIILNESKVGWVGGLVLFFGVFL
jgi:hypothetical protein